LIASIALPGLDYVLRALPDIPAKRPAHIVTAKLACETLARLKGYSYTVSNKKIRNVAPDEA